MMHPKKPKILFAATEYSRHCHLCGRPANPSSSSSFSVSDRRFTCDPYAKPEWLPEALPLAGRHGNDWTKNDQSAFRAA